jgi:hypothetical protein
VHASTEGVARVEQRERVIYSLGLIRSAHGSWDQLITGFCGGLDLMNKLLLQVVMAYAYAVV